MIGALMPFVNAYARGKNTYDEFLQRNILTDDELAARFERGDAVEALLGHAWNSSVGGLVKRYQNPDQNNLQMEGLSKFLNRPVIQPSVGRFLRVVSNGRQQMADAALQPEEHQKALDRLDAKRALLESRRQGSYLLPEFEPVVTRNPYIMDYYMQAYKEEFDKEQKKATPFLNNAVKARSPDVIGRLIDLHNRYK